MAIENTYLLGTNITLGCGFDLNAKAPLDSRQTVPAFAGLQALINYDAAYEGMIVYDEETKKTYQAQKCDPYTVEVEADGKTKVKTFTIEFREFGINEAELKDLIASETTAAMEFKGVAAALPENPSKGDFYKISAAFKVGEEDVKVGDSIVYDGENWAIIPSGDDIEDTWRPVTDVDNDATLTFVAGDKLEKTVAADGTITYKHIVVDAPELLAENEQTRTYITEVKTDGFGHITGYKTATENVVDTNTTYEFEGLPVVEGEDAPSNVYFQVTASDAESAEVIYIDAYNKNETDAAIKVVSDVIDNNKGTWDLAGTAVQISDFNTFKNENTQAIADAVAPKLDKSIYDAYIAGKEMSDADLKKYADDAAGAVDTKLTNYSNAHANDYTNEQIDKAIEDATGALGTMSTKDANDYYTKNDIDGKDFASKTEAQGYATTAQTNAEAKAAELDAALKSELEGKINGVDGKFANSVTNDTYNAYTETQSGVNSGFESRITAVEAKFGEGDDTVEAQIAAAVGAEEQRATGIEDGLRTDVNDALARVKAIEDAPYVTKDQLDDVDAKFANYKTAVDQKVIDDEQDRRLGVLEGASATHATKDELNGVDAKFADYTKTADLPTDLGDFANEAGYAKTADVNVELAKKVDNTTYAADKETFALKTDLNAYRTSAAQDVIDNDFEGRIAALEEIDHDQLAADASAAAVATVLDGAPEKFDTLKEIAAWIAEADTAEDAASLVTRVSALESVKDDYKGADTALKEELEGKIDAINDHSHSFVESELNKIADGDVAKWNNEIGAKALAETKLDASTFTTYSEAHASDYTNTQIDDAIDADVAVVSKALEEYVTANNAVVDTKANAADVYAKTETYTKDEVAAAIEAALTWGEF